MNNLERLLKARLMADGFLKGQKTENEDSDRPKELEEVIVLKPYTDNEVIPAMSYCKSHGHLIGYESSRLKDLVDLQNGAIESLLNVFKRILLFEVGASIGGAYASRLPNEAETNKQIPEIPRAQTMLMSNEDYHASFDMLFQANRSLRSVVQILVSGSSAGQHLFTTNDILNLCKPGQKLENIDASFAGRRVFFSISKGEYANDNPQNEETKFEMKFSNLFRKVAGYILLQSPETVDYAKNFLSSYKFDFQTLEPDKIEIGGRKPIDSFRLFSRK